MVDTSIPHGQDSLTCQFLTDRPQYHPMSCPSFKVKTVFHSGHVFQMSKRRFEDLFFVSLLLECLTVTVPMFVVSVEPNVYGNKTVQTMGWLFAVCVCVRMRDIWTHFLSIPSVSRRKLWMKSVRCLYKHGETKIKHQQLWVDLKQ